ncbi:MAG: PaaI family thioesterase [Methanomicrobiales archaeon]|nr:PaaI family thioesterase [Methanomicrobiales archaeon]
MKQGDACQGETKDMVARFDHCECARLLGMVVRETWPGGARIAMTAEGKRNPNGVVHGGAIFSLADQAFGLAANTGPVRQVAVSATITYLSPARGDLEAVAEQVSETEQHSLFLVRVYDGKRLVATFDGVGIKEKRAKGARSRPSLGEDIPLKTG